MTEERVDFTPIHRNHKCGQFHGPAEPGRVCERCGVPWMEHPLWSPDTVTITISRKDAEHYARPAAILEELQPYLIRLNEACRTALEAERG